MISFYRDFLDGTTYTVVALIAVVLILGIVGFMMEKIKSYKEEQAKIAYDRTKEAEQRGDTIVFDSKADRIVGTPVEKKVDTESNDSSPTITLSPASTSENVTATNDQDVNKRDNVMTIDSSTLDVPEIVEDNTKEPQPKAEDLTQVIDFGSTDDVKIDEL